MHNLLLFAFQVSSSENQGGLFDFNATLPLMALQFIALTVLLNLLFYKPIGNILDERDEYIRNSLTSASASLLQANNLTEQYESELSVSRKKAQEIIKDSQQNAQEVVAQRVKDAQKDAEELLAEAYNQLNIQKQAALKSLETQVEILSDQIRLKLLNFND